MRGKTGADREISVNTYTGGFTTMLNHHLRNRNLSLKAVGLLSKMLSLPPDWDYSIRGLATLNTDGIDGIRTAMKPGEALVLRCNFSEIYSNVLVSVTDGGGAIDFHPSISLMDGHLAELAGVYDFSVYEETPDERSVEIATEILLEYGEVRQGLENGMKLMYTGESEIINGGSCMLFVLGTDNGEQFVQEQLYGVCDNLIYIYDVFTDTWNAAY